MPSPDRAPAAGIRILLADDHTMFGRRSVGSSRITTM
jgi:hypothetical protein